MAAYTSTTRVGPPSSGHFQAGDTFEDATGTVFTCYDTGFPGGWSTGGGPGGDTLIGTDDGLGTDSVRVGNHSNAANFVTGNSFYDDYYWTAWTLSDKGRLFSKITAPFANFEWKVGQAILIVAETTSDSVGTNAFVGLQATAIDNGANRSADVIAGGYFEGVHGGTNAGLSSSIYGISAYGFNSGDGAGAWGGVNFVGGMYASATHLGGVAGFSVNSIAGDTYASGGTIPTVTGMSLGIYVYDYAGDPLINDWPPTITNVYGIKVYTDLEPGAVITNDYGVYISEDDNGATVTNKWGFYQNDARRNWLTGTLETKGYNTLSGVTLIGSAPTSWAAWGRSGQTLYGGMYAETHTTDTLTTFTDSVAAGHFINIREPSANSTGYPNIIGVDASVYGFGAFRKGIMQGSVIEVADFGNYQTSTSESMIGQTIFLAQVGVGDGLGATDYPQKSGLVGISESLEIYGGTCLYPKNWAGYMGIYGGTITYAAGVDDGLYVGDFGSSDDWPPTVGEIRQATFYLDIASGANITNNIYGVYIDFVDGGATIGGVAYGFYQNDTRANYLAGALNVDGACTFDGNVTIGSAASDALIFEADTWSQTRPITWVQDEALVNSASINLLSRTATVTGGNSVSNAYQQNIVLTYNGSTAIGGIVGAYNDVIVSGSGNVDFLLGADFYITVTGSGDVASYSYGVLSGYFAGGSSSASNPTYSSFLSSISIGNTSTITDAYSFKVGDDADGWVSSLNKVTNFYGFFIGALATGAATLTHGFHSGLDAASGVYAFYGAGTAPSYLAGALQVDGQVLTSASTTARAGLVITSGAAPSSPAEGDFWYDGTNLVFRDSTISRVITWT